MAPLLWIKPWLRGLAKMPNQCLCLTCPLPKRTLGKDKWLIYVKYISLCIKHYKAPNKSMWSVESIKHSINLCKVYTSIQHYLNHYKSLKFHALKCEYQWLKMGILWVRSLGAKKLWNRHFLERMDSWNSNFYGFLIHFFHGCFIQTTYSCRLFYPYFSMAFLSM